MADPCRPPRPPCWVKPAPGGPFPQRALQWTYTLSLALIELRNHPAALSPAVQASKCSLVHLPPRRGGWAWPMLLSFPTADWQGTILQSLLRWG